MDSPDRTGRPGSTRLPDIWTLPGIPRNTMKAKTMMLMVVAIGCGLAASYMTSRLLADRAARQSDDTKVSVVVAKQRVSAWIPIKDPDKYFALKEIPEMAAPKKSLKSLDDLKDQRLSKPLGEDEYVTQDHLVNKDMAGVEGVLPPGTRAMAIKVNAECLVGGFVRPSAHVDIVYASRGGGTEANARIILQDMLVLAVDQANQRDPGQPTIIGSTVTLAVKPEEAQQLRVAQQNGELSLALRALGDTERIRIPATKITDLGKPPHDGLVSDATEVAAAPPAAVVLPATLPPPPTEDVKLAPAATPPRKEEPPAESHTMIIYNGEYVQRALFVKNEDGSWKVGGVSGDDPPRRRVDPTPPPSKGGPIDSGNKAESPLLPSTGKSGREP
jgi:pilus assembly protein CpaB